MVNLKLGFGFMRLPVINENPSDINYEMVNGLVDLFIENGGNYFDTGFHYHNGKSEEAIKKCVVERYPRSKVQIADKMPIYGMMRKDNPEMIFNTQLERCGIDYFDYYLIHNTADIFYNGIAKKLKVFDFVNDAKSQGLINHLGISHHDTVDVLKQVLDENPEIEFVQLQINYVDWLNKAVQAKECYELVKDYGLDVFVMEPLKGGNLINVPDKAKELFKNYNGESPVNWAISYVLNLKSVELVLSGMNEEKHLSMYLPKISIARDVATRSKFIICSGLAWFGDAPAVSMIYNDEMSSNVDQMLNFLYYNN